jgi:hypothetical protein
MAVQALEQVNEFAAAMARGSTLAMISPVCKSNAARIDNVA